MGALKNSEREQVKSSLPRLKAAALLFVSAILLASAPAYPGPDGDEADTQPAIQSSGSPDSSPQDSTEGPTGETSETADSNGGAQTQRELSVVEQKVKAYSESDAVKKTIRSALGHRYSRPHKAC